MLLLRVVGVKAAGVHIGKAVAGGKVRKMFLKARPSVGKAGGGGKPRPRAEDDGVSLSQRCAQACNRVGGAVRKFVGRYP